MKRLNLLILRCRDIEKARSFYECFDMSFIKHSHGSGPEHYAAEDDAGVFELYPAAGEAASDQTGLGFDEPELAARFARLAELGFSPKPISQTPWGKSFVVRDPDGRRVEVKQV